MAFGMFQGISTVNGSQSPEGVLQQSAEALFNIGIPLTAKPDGPSIYTTDSPGHSLSLSPEIVSTVQKQPPLPENSLPPIAAVQQNDSLPPLQQPSGDCLSRTALNPALPTTPERKRSMRNFRQVSMGVYALWNDGQN